MQDAHEHKPAFCSSVTHGKSDVEAHGDCGSTCRSGSNCGRLFMDGRSRCCRCVCTVDHRGFVLQHVQCACSSCIQRSVTGSSHFVGASLTATCWGPALGAKAVPFKVALVLGVICQSLGVLVFGPEEYIVYGGLLDESNKLAPYPREAMYSLMWIVVTPVIWQALSIWQKTLVPAYLGTGA